MSLIDVLFLILAGNWQFFCCGRTFSLRPEKKKDTLRPEKKDTVVCLMGARFLRLLPENKRYSCLSGGLCCYVSFWFWQEISIFFVVAGNFNYDQKKKDTVVCWREIGSFFVVAGNFHYDREKKDTL